MKISLKAKAVAGQIIALYIDGKQVPEIMTALSVSRDSVRGILWRECAKYRDDLRRVGRRWTPEEVETLKAHATLLPNEIAPLFPHRTRAAVVTKLRQIRLDLAYGEIGRAGRPHRVRAVIEPEEQEETPPPKRVAPITLPKVAFLDLAAAVLARPERRASA